MSNASNAIPPCVNSGEDTLDTLDTLDTQGEVIANAITSGVGTALSVAGLVLMVVYATRYGSAWHVVGVTIFGVSLVLSHLASTLFHSIASPRARRVLEVFDHLAIYVLIAGTYTPFTLVNLRGFWGWGLFVLIWLLAIGGVLIKLTPLNDVRNLSMASYLVMGWTVVLVIKPLLDNVALGGIWLLLAGGLSYTSGIAFYAWRQLPYNHAIWHVFVIGGGVFHFLAVLFYVIPLAPAATNL